MKKKRQKQQQAQIIHLALVFVHQFNKQGQSIKAFNIANGEGQNKECTVAVGAVLLFGQQEQRR